MASIAGKIKMELELLIQSTIRNPLPNFAVCRNFLRSGPESELRERETCVGHRPPLFFGVFRCTLVDRKARFLRPRTRFAGDS
jgi:hypothetical protein